MTKGISALLIASILSTSATAFAGDSDCDSLAMLRELKGRPKVGQLVAKPSKASRDPAGDVAQAGADLAQNGPSEETRALGGTMAVLGLFGALVGEPDAEKYSRAPVLLVHDGSLEKACKIIADNPKVRTAFHSFAEGVFKKLPPAQQVSIDPAAVSQNQSVSKPGDDLMCLPSQGSGASSANGG